MNFFIWRKKCFVLEMSRFLCFCEIHRFQNLWCHHRHCCIMEVTLVLISFESYVLSKWNLVKYECAVWQTFLACFWLNAGGWKLVPGSFTILLKWHSEIGPFSIADIYHFYMSLIHLFKKIKHWYLNIIGYGVIGAGC